MARDRRPAGRSVRATSGESEAGLPIGRRQVLSDAVAGTLAASSFVTGAARGADTTAAKSGAKPVGGSPQPDEPDLPPHKPVPLSGVHAYAPASVRAGESVPFHVSSSVAYRFSLVRLGSEPLDTSRDVELATAAGPSAPHAIHPGSYVHVATSPLPAAAEELTLSCWVRPFRTAGPRQAIMARRRDDATGGYGLYLEDGKLVLEAGPLGDTGRLAAAKARVANRRWQHVAAVIAADRLLIFLNGKQVAERPRERGAALSLAADAPLRLGSAGQGERAGYFLDGDLSGVAIHGVALASAQIEQIAAGRGLELLTEPPPLAWWTFAEETGAHVGDASGHGHHGRIINQATWMIGGPSFEAGRIGKYDAYDPEADPTRGHGLRLAADDLVDCHWPVAHEPALPADAPSGLYCGRFEYEAAGRTFEHNVTFVVRRAVAAAKPPILVLAATNTWRAYNWFPFAANRTAGRHDWRQGSVAKGADPAMPAGCFYRDHSAGQPTYKVGLRVPCESADPYRCYRGHESWGQWVACERRLHLWLDRHGYPYEVIADLDLDADPTELDGRQVLVVVGHSEYWTLPAYAAVERFLARGGNLVVLSGNTMFWRAERLGEAALECRKYGTGMLGRPWTKPGELYHGRDARRGGLLRFCGAPGWKLTGLETAGWCQGLDFLPYTASAADHPLFHEPHEVGVKAAEEFGFFSGLGVVGHEYDVRPSILVAATPTMPPGSEDVADPPGITVLAECRADRKIADYHATANLSAENPAGVISEIILWERPDGGQVFSIGSVSAAWGVYEDERLGRLLANVLHRFGAGR